MDITARLERMGARVERLVIFDAPAPAPLPVPDEATLRAWFAEDVPDPEEEEASGLYALFRAVVLASRAYRGARVDAPILLLRAGDGRVTEFAGHPARGDDWGWAAYSPAVTIAYTPGTHHTMLAAAAELAGVIDQ
jgi:thioesterase domain-containing protein